MLRSESRDHVARVLGMIERGQAPAGVDGWLVESWYRSVERYRLDPGRSAHRRVLSGGELRELADRMGVLLDVAKPHLEALERSVAVANYCVLLTDADGRTIDYRHQSDPDHHFRRAGIRVGICWSEEEEGTCGIGTTIVNRTPTLVHKAEHFRAENIVLSCSAAPVFGLHDELLGVLDASTLYSPYQRDSQALVFGMVKEKALQIENAFVERALQQHWRLALAPRRGACPPEQELLVAFDEGGRIVGANRPARQRGFGGPGCETVDTLFGCEADELLRQASAAPGLAMPLRLEATGERLYGVVRAPERGAPRAATALRRLSGMASPAPLAPRATSIEPASATAGHAEARAVAPAGREQAFAHLALGDPALRDAMQRACRVADREIPVMLLGETGTGKEAFAQALHRYSQRRERPFVALNCAAIPESLIESELFGYEDGAFTGARARGSRGKILQADGGTLFLDEIGDMPLLLQSRLLRVLAEGEVLPLGGEQPMRVRLHVICATHQDLSGLIEAGRFRADLYYRLSGAVFRLPALRERQDQAELIDCIRREEAAAVGRRGVMLAADTLAALQRYPWPGNVRQLRHALRYALAVSEQNPLPLEAFPADILAACAAPMPPGATAVPSADDAPPDGPPKERMLWALRRHKWHVTAAALALGMPRSSFYRKMKAYRIVPPNEA